MKKRISNQNKVNQIDITKQTANKTKLNSIPDVTKKENITQTINEISENKTTEIITQKTKEVHNNMTNQTTIETSTTTTTKPTNDETLSLKELRETFYHCRDFEITNLWQRSVFLFGFILACFTGYGTILISLMTSGFQNITDPWLAHLIECAISLIGIVFAQVWIMMSKGSKIWYEIYERVIGEIENKNGKSTKYVNIPKEYIMGNYSKQYEDYIDDDLASLKGGKYSPSKLNISIGHVLLSIWKICFFCHCIILIVNAIDNIFSFSILETLYNYRFVLYPTIACVLAWIVYLFITSDHYNVKSKSIGTIKES